MMKVKNIIYYLFVVIIIYMENICTNIYYMSGGIKGGDSILLCILLLFFIVYDLCLNNFLFRLLVSLIQVIFCLYSISKNIEMRDIADNIIEYSKRGCDVVPMSDYDFLLYWKICCLFLLYLLICLTSQYIYKLYNNTKY